MHYDGFLSFFFNLNLDARLEYYCRCTAFVFGKEGVGTYWFKNNIKGHNLFIFSDYFFLLFYYSHFLFVIVFLLTILLKNNSKNIGKKTGYYRDLNVLISLLLVQIRLEIPHGFKIQVCSVNKIHNISKIILRFCLTSFYF